jgi:chemotaxis protein MotB
MYSVSTVNNIEYETLSEALEEAFTNEKVEETVETEVEEQAEDPESVTTTIEPIILDNPVTEEKRDLSEEILKERRFLQQISENFEDVLQPYIENDLVKVIRNDFWIELEMKSELLFVSGEADFSSRAKPILEKIADLVRRMPNIINVEGHTDDMPIDTMRFSSNWELSSARATSVVREFVNYGISPKRLAAIGYGEHHPITENTNEGSRKKNRRVVLVLMSRAFARYGMTDEERANLLNFNRSEKQNSAL